MQIESIKLKYKKIDDFGYKNIVHCFTTKVIIFEFFFS